MKTHNQVYIDFFEDEEMRFDFSWHGSFSFDLKEVIIDPSFLYYLTSHKIKETQITFFLPDSLIKLIDLSKKNLDYQQLLKSFLTYFRYGWGRKLINKNLDILYWNIDKMRIKPIILDDIISEPKDYYYDSILNSFIDHNFYISMSPKLNLLGDCIGKILEFSKKKNKIILSKSRKLAKLIQGKVISLELPERADSTIKAKSSLINKIFDFKGGKAAKFFIGISLGIGGYIHPVIGGVGLVFAFFDP